MRSKHLSVYFQEFCTFSAGLKPKIDLCVGLNYYFWKHTNLTTEPFTPSWQRPKTFPHNIHHQHHPTDHNVHSSLWNESFRGKERVKERWGTFANVLMPGTGTYGVYEHTSTYMVICWSFDTGDGYHVNHKQWHVYIYNIFTHPLVLEMWN